MDFRFLVYSPPLNDAYTLIIYFLAVIALKGVVETLGLFLTVFKTTKYFWVFIKLLISKVINSFGPFLKSTILLFVLFIRIPDAVERDISKLFSTATCK